MVCRPVHLEQAFFLDNCQFVGSGVSPLSHVYDRAVIIGHDGLPGRPTTAGQDRVKVDMSKAAPGPLVIDSGGQHSWHAAQPLRLGEPLTGLTLVVVFAVDRHLPGPIELADRDTPAPGKLLVGGRPSTSPVSVPTASHSTAYRSPHCCSLSVLNRQSGELSATDRTNAAMSPSPLKMSPANVLANAVFRVESADGASIKSVPRIDIAGRPCRHRCAPSRASAHALPIDILRGPGIHCLRRSPNRYLTTVCHHSVEATALRSMSQGHG